MRSIEKLENLLNSINDSYFEFVDSVISDCKAQDEKFTKSIIKFIENNPTANSSEVLEYELYELGLPYCEEGIWYQKDKIITEDEARQIVETRFNNA